MDDPLRVRRFESLGNLAHRREDVANRQRSRDETLGEGFARDELENEGAGGPNLLEPVNGRDVRMGERGEDLCLPIEARPAIGVRQEGVGEHLDCNVAPESRVPRAIDLPHSSGAERREDLVGTEAGADSEGHDGRPIRRTRSMYRGSECSESNRGSTAR